MFVFNNIQVERITTKRKKNGISSTDCLKGTNTCEKIKNLIFETYITITKKKQFSFNIGHMHGRQPITSHAKHGCNKFGICFTNG